MSRLTNHTLKLNQTLNNNIGYAVILPSHEFHLRVKQMWHLYKYVLNHPFRQDTYIQATYQNVVFRDYILTLPLYNVYIREFKDIWHKIYKADYCLKHLKLVYHCYHIIKYFMHQSGFKLKNLHIRFILFILRFIAYIETRTNRP